MAFYLALHDGLGKPHFHSDSAQLRHSDRARPDRYDAQWLVAVTDERIIVKSIKRGILHLSSHIGYSEMYKVNADDSNEQARIRLPL